jgi:signal transduction histidine kinase
LAIRTGLQQVIWNVLANAVKFTPSGGTVSLAMVRRGVRRRSHRHG